MVIKIQTFEDAAHEESGVSTDAYRWEINERVEGLPEIINVTQSFSESLTTQAVESDKPAARMGVPKGE